MTREGRLSKFEREGFSVWNSLPSATVPSQVRSKRGVLMAESLRKVTPCVWSKGFAWVCTSEPVRKPRTRIPQNPHPWPGHLRTGRRRLAVIEL